MHFTFLNLKYHGIYIFNFYLIIRTTFGKSDQNITLKFENSIREPKQQESSQEVTIKVEDEQLFL